jgi:hypothetical protein
MNVNYLQISARYVYSSGANAILSAVRLRAFQVSPVHLQVFSTKLQGPGLQNTFTMLAVEACIDASMQIL